MRGKIVNKNALAQERKSPAFGAQLTRDAFTVLKLL
jgi:hypothetical protein